MNSSRRSFLKQSAVAGMAVTLFPGRLFSIDESRFKLIRRNVGFYVNRGGTIGWLVNSDSTVAIDSQYPETAADCIAGLQKKRIAEIDCLINTHHHGDHTGGNGTFRKYAKNIVAHENVPELQRSQMRMRGNSDDSAIADITFASTWTGSFGDETITATHYGPAHTGGDAVIHFQQANVVHMGDLIFNRVYPFIDLPGGASVKGWALLLEKVMETHNDALFVFGHGQPSFGITGDVNDVKVMRDFLTAVWEHVEKGVSNGASREEIVSAVSFPGFEDFTSLGPRLSLGANLEVAFDEITSEK